MQNALLKAELAVVGAIAGPRPAAVQVLVFCIIRQQPERENRSRGEYNHEREGLETRRAVCCLGMQQERLNGSQN